MLKNIKLIFFVNCTKLFALYSDIVDREASCKFTKHTSYAGVLIENALLKISLSYEGKLQWLFIQP